MRTLYLRNVPDEVLERLELLAEREGRSVSATAIRELDSSTRRVHNAALFAALPDLKADFDVVTAIREDREARWS